MIRLFFQMSARVYCVPGQTEGRSKTFLEWKSIDLSCELSLTCGGNVNYYKSVYQPIPTHEKFCFQWVLPFYFIKWNPDCSASKRKFLKSTSCLQILHQLILLKHDILLSKAAYQSVNFWDFRVLGSKFVKFLISILNWQVNSSSNFVSFFIVMTQYSPVNFELINVLLSIKGSH